MMYNKAVVMATGNDRMVAVNVLVPAEMRAALDQLAQQKKWTIAVTVREAIERLLEAEVVEKPRRK
jgi:predicted DNA-binding protein